MPPRRRAPSGLLALIVLPVLFIGGLTVPAVATEATPGIPVPSGARPGGLAVPATSPPPVLKDPRFDTLLGLLAREVRDPGFEATLAAGEPFPIEALSEPLRAAVEAGLLRIDESGGVQVYVRAGTSAPSSLTGGAAALVTSLEDLGGSLQEQETRQAGQNDGWLLQARIPARALETASSLPGVRLISAPRYAVTDIGSKLTAGDAILRALETRAQHGVDGTGVRIGVISDGLYGLASAIATGDLPSTELVYSGARLVETRGGVTAVSFRQDHDLEAGLGGGRGAEGVAMLEILHDLAPGASLWFANFATSLEFNRAVNYLAANTDIVVDDISFFGGPYDGTSEVSANAAAALNDPANPVRALFTSAGNRALDHYEEEYVPSGSDGADIVGSPGKFHLFRETAKTSDALGQSEQPQNQIYLFRNQSAIIILTWDDPPEASWNDYDLFLFRESSGARVAVSGALQNGSQPPLEALVYTNTGSQGFFEVRVHNYLDSAEPRTLEIFIIEVPFRTYFPNGATLNYNTVSGSIAMMADAGGGVLSVGAIDAAEPDDDAMEPFSGRGPTNDGRLKPDLASIDGVAVTGAGGFPTAFFGTSAAAPHAAAVTALLLQMAPCLTGAPGDPDAAGERVKLRSLIQDHAIDLYDPGPDNTSGHGRNDALAAATPMLPVADPGPSPFVTECSSPSGSPVGLDGTASTPFHGTCPLEYRWSGPFGETSGVTPIVPFPLGSSDVTLDVSQNGGVTWASAAQTVLVRDTLQPVMAGALDLPVLWPPNHRLETVTLGVTMADACDAAPSLRLDSVLSDEPDDAAGLGDGHTSGDIQGTELGAPDTRILLRAERDGTGDGRTYAVRYTGQDASGNQAGLALTVRVPRELGGGGPEPLSLDLNGAETLRWSPVAGATAYQVVRGELDPSSVVRRSGAHDLGPAVCLWSGPAGQMPASLVDAATPAPGRVFFYLAQYDEGLGYTGFGTASGSRDLTVAPTGCR